MLPEGIFVPNWHQPVHKGLLLHLNPFSVTTRLAAAAGDANLWPVSMFLQWGVVLVVVRRNFRWAGTTVLTSTAVWGLQLCRQQYGSMAGIWTSQRVSSSVQLVLGLFERSERSISRGASAVHLSRGLWGESHMGSHAEVFETLDCPPYRHFDPLTT